MNVTYRTVVYSQYTVKQQAGHEPTIAFIRKSEIERSTIRRVKLSIPLHKKCPAAAVEPLIQTRDRQPSAHMWPRLGPGKGLEREKREGWRSSYVDGEEM